jgi:hypothetical protein
VLVHFLVVPAPSGQANDKRRRKRRTTVQRDERVTPARSPDLG